MDSLPIGVFSWDTVPGFNMATEIELKARITNADAMRSVLCEKAEYASDFEKDDTYWFPNVKPDAHQNEQLKGTEAYPGVNHPRPKIRLRRERREFPDGQVKYAAFATCKEKNVRDGIETNDEHEFMVHPAEEFEIFLGGMGLIPGASKKKRGWAFRHGEICAELVEVLGLGWFIELETIVESANGQDKAEEAQAREKLLAFLSELGIGKESIESRFYSEMLSTL